jgi:hypothetical protein
MYADVGGRYSRRDVYARRNFAILTAAPDRRGSPRDLAGGRGQHLTAHVLRATLRIWAAERTSFPQAVCELALAHRSFFGAVDAVTHRPPTFRGREGEKVGAVYTSGG